MKHVTNAIATAIGTPLECVQQRRWASATFAGVAMVLQAASPLPTIGDDFDVTIPGYLLADVQTEGSTMRALLVECEA